jgi:NAD(P)-dependent dehydrogenase (short-subunit alcohol dehydrogenase family)
MGRLDGKVCVITGAGGGIGRASALHFGQEGARVAVVDIAHDAGLAVVAELTAAGVDSAFFPCDVTLDESVASLYEEVGERFGSIDVLFNNAGIVAPGDGSVIDTDPAIWQRVLAVNLTGVFLCCRHGIPRLLESGGGSVINTASFVAVMGAATSQIAYTAAKGGVLSLTREIAVEFARRGVRANALCPGPIDTPLLREVFDTPEALDRRLIHVPAGRLGRPEDIAHAAVYLASEESSWVTGTTFLVDGGITAAYVTPE